jgi:hypothetical protein
MEREQLEHVLRAAAAITREDEFVVIGSQSILGAVPDAPADMKMSREVDLYPLHRPELADLIDGALGEASQFDDTFGYYAQGVGPETAVIPVGWKERLIRVSGPATRGAIGWCLDPHDLVASKYAANREKDRVFCRSAIRHRVVSAGTLVARAGLLPLPAERIRSITAAIERDLRDVES